MKNVFKVCLLILAFSSGTAFAFLNGLGDAMKKSATDSFKQNTMNDTNSVANELSVSKLAERRRRAKEEQERKRAKQRQEAQRQQLAQEQQRNAAQQRQQRAPASVSAPSSSCGSADNPVNFSNDDLQRVDSYAKNMGVDRTTAIRILATQALNK